MTSIGRRDLYVPPRQRVYRVRRKYNTGHLFAAYVGGAVSLLLAYLWAVTS